MEGGGDRVSDEVKRIDIKEFREKGYLQELNRRFLHPLGLALEIIIEDNGEERLGGIWDYRDDPEGMSYDLKHSDLERINKFVEKANNINREWNRKIMRRVGSLGYMVEPIPEVKEGED